METYVYTVHLEPAEEGGYVVTVPALPGCITQGETYGEAIAMAEDCIRGFVEALAKSGLAAP
jgi:antitoxin HicB